MFERVESPLLRWLAIGGVVVALAMLGLFHSVVQGQVQRSADKAARYAAPTGKAQQVVVVTVRGD